MIRFAWRLIAGRPGIALLAVACIAIGVAARSAVTGFVTAVERNLTQEARVLLTGDIELSASRPFSATELATITATLPPQARTLPGRSLTAMAAAGNLARLVELRAIAPGYPLAGRLEAEPAAELGSDGCLVQADLLAQLAVTVGDRIRIGAGTFRIVGTITREPGVSTSFFRFGPRVYVPLDALAGAGLDGSAVRARHLLHALLPDPTTASTIAARLRTQLGLPGDISEGSNDAPLTARSADEAAAQGARHAVRAADFLRLVALFALLLGAIGVAALARGLLHAQAESLAVLRTLGASARRTVGIFATQALLLGLAGGALGLVLGWAGAAVATRIAGLALIVPGPGDLALALGIGALVGLVAAAAPALALVRMQPLAVLRGEAPPAIPSASAILVLLTATALAVVAAALEARSWFVGPAVAGGTVLAALVLAGAARLLLPLGARLRPTGFALRHGLANLGRPGRGAIALAVALGLAATLASALLTLRAALAAELAPERSTVLPGLFAIDIQPDQREAIVKRLRRQGLEPNLRPLLRARLTAVDGVEAAATPVGNTREDEHRARFRRREQNLSWAAAPGPGERLISGTWPITGDECAVEQRWAGRVGVHLGSELRFDVQGVPLDVRITGLRQVDWWTAQPNFFIVLGPGQLAEAPHTWVGTVPNLPAAERRGLTTALAGEFPNVSWIDIADAAAEARRVIDRIAAALGAVAAVALLAALAVVAGTSAAAARERRSEAALVRALGGTRRTVATALLVEHGCTAGLAALLGTALGLIAGRALGGLVLDVPPVHPWLQLAALIGVLTTAATLAALLAGRRAWRVPPLAALREA